MDRIILAFNSQEEGIGELKEFFLSNYDVQVKILNVQTQDFQEISNVVCLSIAAIGGGVGIKAILDGVTNLINRSSTNIKVNSKGEVEVTNITPEKFLELYKTINEVKK